MTRRFAIAILVLATTQAWSLFDAWLHSPYDQLGTLAAAIWIIPVFLTRRGEPSPRLAWIAAGLALAGAALDFHLLGQAALAAAAGALVVRSISRPAAIAWLGSSICWMPVFSYLLGGLAGAAPPLVMGLRLAMAVAGCAAACMNRRPQPAT